MRRAHAATGLIAAAGLLAAGCGTATLPTRPAAAASAAGSLSAAATAPAGPASQELNRLLALVPVPPGGVALALPPPGRVTPGGPLSSQLTRSRQWRLPVPVSAAAAWVTAHPPAGFTAATSDPGSGAAASSRAYTYRAPAGPDWRDAVLTVQLTTAGPGRTVERADATVVWPVARPTPAAPPAAGPA